MHGDTDVFIQDHLGRLLSGIVGGWERKLQFYLFHWRPRSWAMYLTTSIYRIDFLLFQPWHYTSCQAPHPKHLPCSNDIEKRINHA